MATGGLGAEERWWVVSLEGEWTTHGRMVCGSHFRRYIRHEFEGLVQEHLRPLPPHARPHSILVQTNQSHGGIANSEVLNEGIKLYTDSGKPLDFFGLFL